MAQNIFAVGAASVPEATNQSKTKRGPQAVNNAGSAAQKTKDEIEKLKDAYYEAELKFLCGIEGIQKRCAVFKLAALWEEEHLKDDDGHYPEDAELIDWKTPLEDLWQATGELFSATHDLQRASAACFAPDAMPEAKLVETAFDETRKRIERMINMTDLFSQAACYQEENGRISAPDWADGFDIFLDAISGINAAGIKVMELIQNQVADKLQTEEMLCAERR